MNEDKIILWEAHRGGGGYELPESAPVGVEYARMPDGTPEADGNNDPAFRCSRPRRPFVRGG